ncbi:MAG TPA: hypothetical protein VN851_10060 [Thermoanaerobaculia bacterium]|nr:hypothetical protein [Thermoanaerobaculia bacterium]
MIAENENHIDLHGNNAAILARLFDNRARQVFLDTTDPLKTADGLETALQDYADLGCRKIVVDITTFTHEGFLIVFNLLRRHFDPSEVSYFYAGAREYSVGAKDSEKWLSKGIGEIRSVLGYSGRFLPSRKLHLITLVGFEHERVNELIRRYEPSVISLGYGESAEPGAEYHHPPNRIGYSRVKAVYANAREFSFYCYDPERTKQIIQAQVQEVPRTNVIVAAFNTKLSTMGVALAALEDDSIQLCYAQALTYNYSAYSRAGDKAYLIEEG